MRRYEKGTSEEEIAKEAFNYLDNYSKSMDWPQDVRLVLTNMGDAGENTDLYNHFFYTEEI